MNAQDSFLTVNDTVLEFLKSLFPQTHFVFQTIPARTFKSCTLPTQTLSSLLFPNAFSWEVQLSKVPDRVKSRFFVPQYPDSWHEFYEANSLWSQNRITPIFGALLLRSYFPPPFPPDLSIRPIDASSELNGPVRYCFGTSQGIARPSPFWCVFNLLFFWCLTGGVIKHQNSTVLTILRTSKPADCGPQAWYSFEVKRDFSPYFCKIIVC